MALAGNDGRVARERTDGPRRDRQSAFRRKETPAAHARRARRRLWRHRHQPDLCVPRGAACVDRRRAGRRASDVLGVLSLIVWALTIIVTIKYIAFVLRADNRGEGGTLSLMALARGELPKRAGADPRRSASAARRCSSATPSSRRRSRCCRRSRASKVVTPTLRCLRRADHAGDPGDPVFGAALRDGQCRRGVRAGHRAVVPGHRAFPASSTSPTTRRCFARSIRLLSRSPISHSAPGRRLRDDRRGVPGRHRRGGALCRSRPFRAQADRAGLAGDRLSRACCSTISGRAPSCSRMAALSAIRSSR